jgi:hypothetical protein
MKVTQGVVERRFVDFERQPNSETGVTQFWFVYSKGKVAIKIATIQWFGRFRAYSIYPIDETVYDAKCLREIADFLDLLTAQQRHNARERKKLGNEQTKSESISANSRVQKTVNNRRTRSK